MRYAPRAILACGLGFAVSFLAACGGGRGLLSGDQSIALSGQADQIDSAVQNGQCGAARNASLALNQDVQSLPVTINPTLRRNLIQGASTIARLAPKDCHLHTTTTSSSTTSSSTTTTQSTSTTSTSRPTSTSSTSSTSSSATTPTVPGSTSSTTGGAGLGGSTTTGTGNGTSGGTTPGTTTSGAPGGGG